MQPGPDDPNNPQQPPTPPGSYPPPPPLGDQSPYAQQPAYGAQQPYGTPPPYGPPGPTGASNTQGLVGMILGIAAIPLLCCLYLGLPVGIAAVILSWLGLQKANSGAATNRSQAMAGLICGGVAIVLGIAGLIYSIASGAWNVSNYMDR